MVRDDLGVELLRSDTRGDDYIIHTGFCKDKNNSFLRLIFSTGHLKGE